MSDTDRHLFFFRLFPIREEAADLVKKDNTANVLFLNCQKFQSRKNLATMKYFEKLNESNQVKMGQRDQNRSKLYLKHWLKINHAIYLPRT